MVKISAIVVVAKNGAIGKENGLLFNIPGDLPRFKRITLGHPVIMGRKTFESKEINKKPLPNRLNIVVTRDPNYSTENGVIVCRSIEQAIEKATLHDKEEIFIIGGGQIFKESWELIDKLYLTYVDKEVDGDTYLPQYSDFTKVILKKEHEVSGLRYIFWELER